MPKPLDPYTVTLEECKQEIEKKLAKDDIAKDLPKTIAELDGESIEMKYGRFGIYLSYKEKNYRIPKMDNITNITSQDAIDIVKGKKKSVETKPLRKFSSGAEILNGKFGEYIKYNGKNYKMPKGWTAQDITEEEVNKVISK